MPEEEILKVIIIDNFTFSLGILTYQSEYQKLKIDIREKIPN